MAARPRGRLTLALCLAVLLCALLCALPRLTRATSTNLFALPGGSGSACSQAAPCALSKALSLSVPGDSLYLGAGTYTSTGVAVISTTRAISILCGWNGSATGPLVRDPAAYRSTIDGQDQRRGIYISGPGRVTVDGCVIVRGSAASGPDAGRGGGVYCNNALPWFTNNVISTCVGITSSSVGWGGGIYVVNASGQGQISGNLIRRNHSAERSAGYGGGVAINLSQGVSVVQNQILYNSASFTAGLAYGGGMYIGQCERITIQGNEFRANAAQLGLAPAQGSFGGGIAIGLSNYVTVTDNLIRGNYAGMMSKGAGGGVALYGCRSVVMRHNTLDGNIACSATGAPRGAGGGISANQTDPLWLDRNTVIRNVASQSQWGYGGGLYLSMGTRFTMTNNIIAGNNATQQGGGLAFDTDVPLPVTGTLLHNTFASNDAGTGDGQDAIHANLPRVILTGANNLFHDHRYALYADSGAGITLTRSLFFGNSAGDIYGKGVSNISPLTGQDPRLDSTQRLNAGSAAIDAGVNAGVVVDIDGDPRPMGGGFDIGADEFYQYTEWHMLYLPLVVR